MIRSTRTVPLFLVNLFIILELIQATGTGRTNECRRQNGGCVHQCTELDESYRCSCYPGFTMSRDGRNCEDVDECLVDNGGCQHICSNVIGSYECSCRDQYSLSSNEHTCISTGNNNDNQGDFCNFADDFCDSINCTLRRNACSCRAGYRLHVDDKTCIRLCTHGNGGCQHRCIDRGRKGTFCKCRRSYVLHSDHKSCKESQTRNSLPTAPNILMRKLRAASSCSVDNGGCDINCEETPLGVQCSCPHGFNPHSDRRSCEDIDECVYNKGGCQHRCRNSHGSYQCSCDSGYKLALDEKSCVDINECDFNDTCQYKCLNSLGSYECICPNGFQKYAVARCGDIDECAENNGGCGQKCTNTDGSFLCSCEKGFILHQNKKDCIAENNCLHNRLKETRIANINCSKASKSCSFRCFDNEYFVATTSPPKYVYSCGKDPSLSSEIPRYQWMTSHLYVNKSSVHCSSIPTSPYKTKFRMNTKHCNLGTTNSFKPTVPSGTSNPNAAVLSIIITCEPLKKKSRKRISVELELLIMKPKMTRKCNHVCVGKKVAKIGKGIAKNMKRSINKQQFYLRFIDYHLTVGSRGGFDAIRPSGCVLGLVWEPIRHECIRCDTGERFELDTDTCTPCSGSFYQDKPGQLSCVSCPVLPEHKLLTGENPTSEPTAITKCAGWCKPGTFSYSGFPPCHRCPRGTYQPEAGRVGCYTCGSGITTRSEGSITFEDCAVRAKCGPGYYFDIRVSTCIRCPYGFYQPDPGQNYCKRCPSNTTTDFDGSTGIGSCKNRICGGTIGDFQGVIESPNYPGDYPIDIHCQWNIIPPKGRRILLVVPKIDLARQENCGDKLVMKKSAIANSVVTYESCQSFGNPIALTSRSKRLWIEFSSDSQDTGKGFQIPYVTYDENYDTIIKDIVTDGRLYSASYHQEILKDKQSRQTLFEVLAHPKNYFVLKRQNFRGLFPKAFINFLQEKVIRLLNPVELN